MGLRLVRPELVHLKESGAFFPRPSLQRRLHVASGYSFELWDFHSQKLS